MKKIGKGGSRGSGKAKDFMPDFNKRNDKRVARSKRREERLVKSFSK